MMQLRDPRRRDGENPRDLAQRDILQVVQHDHRRLGLGQAGEAPQDGATILRGENDLVGARGGGISQPFRQGEIFLAVAVFGAFIERNQLMGLSLRLVVGEICLLNAQGRRHFRPGRLAFQMFGQIRRNTRDTPVVFMDGTGCPIPPAQLIQDCAPNPHRAITPKRGTSGTIVPGGGAEVAEDSCTLKILMIEESFVIVTHNGLLMCYYLEYVN